MSARCVEDMAHDDFLDVDRGRKKKRTTIIREEETETKIRYPARSGVSAALCFFPWSFHLGYVTFMY